MTQRGIVQPDDSTQELISSVENELLLLSTELSLLRKAQGDERSRRSNLKVRLDALKRIAKKTGSDDLEVRSVSEKPSSFDKEVQQIQTNIEERATLLKTLVDMLKSLVQHRPSDDPLVIDAQAKLQGANALLRSLDFETIDVEAETSINAAQHPAPTSALLSAEVRPATNLELDIAKEFHLQSSSILHMQMALPASLTTEGFSNIAKTIEAVGFIYGICLVVSHGDEGKLRRFTSYLKETRSVSELSTASVELFLEAVNLQPLRITAVRYGSPVSVDFLGFGQALETVREIIKDIAWRGKHEKQMAELERTSKQFELSKSSLEAEKTAVGIDADRIGLQRAALENEKLLTEIASQRLELLLKAKSLSLPDEDRQLLTIALLPKLHTLAENPVVPLLGKRKTDAQAPSSPIVPPTGSS